MYGMITRKDLEEFFQVISNDTDEKYNTLLGLSMNEKLMARRVIQDLRIDDNYRGVSADGQLRLLHVKENFSDFKIGESVELCLQRNNQLICGCKINEFREDGDIEIVISSYNFSDSIDVRCANELLFLQPQKNDLTTLYYNFLMNNNFFQEGYWENHLINTIPKPLFDSYEDSYCKETEAIIRSGFGCLLNVPQKEAFFRTEKAQNYYLIQGPPGTGKSHIISLLLYSMWGDGKKIVVVGPTHTSVNNILVKLAEMIVKVSRSEETAETLINNTILKCGQGYNARGLTVSISETKDVKIKNITHLPCGFLNDWVDDSGKPIGIGWVIGMTPYALQSKRARDLKFDVLVVDEAGQLTIPLAWMAMVDKCKVVLAGDHKQLPPIVSSNVVNEELHRSVFEHLCRDYNTTMLNVTYRMNDVICELVSSLFYDGKLKPFDGSRRLKTTLSEPLYSGEYPLVFVNCNENGIHRSQIEAKKVIEIIQKYVKSGIASSDIAVLAPFRAQCALLRRLLIESELSIEARRAIVIDTVDRMQGQEREIILYCFSAGDVEYMRKLEDFLFNANKLNVVFSRAKNKLILLGNLSSLRIINNQLINRLLQFSRLKII